MRKRIVVPTLAALAALTTPTLPLHAQNGTTFREPPIPSITSSAQQEAKVSPDRARVSIAVQTRAATAAAAAADNAKKQTAILAALRSAGLTDKQLSTTGYTVQPEYRYEQNKEPKVVGYTVTNTVSADIHDINTVGKILDAALGAGANQISSLDFYASNTDSAQQAALAVAVVRARAEAQAAARAAGGTLGDLLDMTISGGQQVPPPRPIMYKTMAMGAADESTPINPGDQTVLVNVSARWRYIPGNQ
jgi:uncharacterized protein YggE